MIVITMTMVALMPSSSPWPWTARSCLGDACDDGGGGVGGDVDPLEEVQEVHTLDAAKHRWRQSTASLEQVVSARVMGVD